MNPLPIRVYRNIKMRIPILLFLLFPFQCLLAQATPLPYELERMPESFYEENLHSLPSQFTSEIDALNYYFTAYKRQRAKHPGIYFPEPDSARKKASTYLSNQFPEGAAMTLVHFLESSGDWPSCEILIKASVEYKLLLPYQYIAARLMQDESKGRYYLSEVKKAQMLSPVLINFGKNAVASSGDFPVLITQGIQDLIAIDNALPAGTNKKVINRFLETCKAYSGTTTENELKTQPEKCWISPSTAFNRSGESKATRRLMGIGFVKTYDPEATAETMEAVGRSFSGLGDTPDTPADRGLISAYRYFANSYLEYSENFGSDSDRVAARQLFSYIQTGWKD